MTTYLEESQVEEIRTKALRGLSAVEDFRSRPFKYSAWLTNICLGFMGFYVALLLQMKSTNFEISIVLSIVFFVEVLIPIIIGIIIRIKREIVLAYSSFTSFMKSFQALMLSLEKIVKEDENAPSEIDDDFDWSVEKFDKWKKGLPLGLIYFQTVFMVGSFISLVLGLAYYLFS